MRGSLRLLRRGPSRPPRLQGASRLFVTFVVTASDILVSFSLAGLGRMEARARTGRTRRLSANRHLGVNEMVDPTDHYQIWNLGKRLSGVPFSRGAILFPGGGLMKAAEREIEFLTKIPTSSAAVAGGV